MPSTTPDTSGSKTVAGWENAAAAAGAVFAGWAVGRGKTVGVVAGLAAAAGMKALAGRQKGERELAPSPPAEPQAAAPEDSSLCGLFEAPPEDPAAVHWQKVAMSLMQVVHSMATRPPVETPVIPAPRPALAYDQGPLIWDSNAMPESRSDAWGNTVWYGMTDLMSPTPARLASNSPVVEDAEVGVCEVILPPPPVAPRVMREEPPLPQVLVTAEIPTAPSEKRMPAPLELAREKAAREALMQALQAEPVSGMEFTFPLADDSPQVSPPPAAARAALARDECPMEAAPVFEQSPLPNVPLPMKEECPLDAAPVFTMGRDSLNTEVPAAASREAKGPTPRNEAVSSAQPAAEPVPVVAPKDANIFALLVARQPLDLNAPTPRAATLPSPRASSQPAVTSTKSATPHYSGSKLVPMAPNSVKKGRTLWPRLLSYFALCAIGLWLAVQWKSEGSFIRNSLFHRSAQGHGVFDADPAHSPLARAIADSGQMQAIEDR